MEQITERSISPDKIFFAIPFIKSYFKDMDGKIRFLKSQEGKEEELKKLKKKRSELYETAKYLCSEDLQIIYYLRKLKRIAPHHFLNALKKLCEAQEELLALLKEGELPPTP